VPGYFSAIKAVCDRHGALLILDEVMSGMGRTGTLHAWEQEGAVPDLQTVAKGLGAGYAPIGALLVGSRVVDALTKGTGSFLHSQTYQGHPVACAAAVAVQRVIRDDNLLENVQVQGKYLGELLKERLSGHGNIGDIRGRGLFWAVCSPFPSHPSPNRPQQMNWVSPMLTVTSSNSSKTKQQKNPSQPQRLSPKKSTEQVSRRSTASP
jgi:adenosylmethionine-8-amino-7-oxononanoate aminotransferase